MQEKKRRFHSWRKTAYIALLAVICFLLAAIIRHHGEHSALTHRELTHISKSQTELTVHATHLELLLVNMAGQQNSTSSALQGTTSLEGMSRQQLAQHAAHLEELVLQHADSLRMPNASVNARAVSNATTDCDRPALPKWCHAFGACNTTDVALVGNGPLTEEQQRELSSGAFQVVIRLNFMNNRADGEQVDVWVMRKADDARLHFWGISQMEKDNALEAIAAAKSLWFLGDINSEIDNYWHMMQPVYRHFPEVKAKHHVLLDFNHLTSPKGFEAKLPKNDTVSPSSGWIGAIYALHCSQPLGAKLHVFGFNWNTRHSDTHSIKDEEQVFREAAKEGFVIIHPTACDGLRTCSANETHKDCHLTRNSKTGQHEYHCAGNLGLKSPSEKSKSTKMNVNLKDVISLRDKIA